MWTTPFVFVWTILNINYAQGLSCYHCSNIADTRTCKQTVDCPDGKACPVITSVPILGRRDGSGLKSYCCDQDLCNGGQTELTTTTIQTPEVCIDINTAFCSTTSVQASICSDPELSVTWCRKTCGKCPTTTTTTMVPCVDNNPDLCSAPGADLVFCSDPARAVKYCQKTCNKCGIHPHQNTTATVHSTTAKTTTTTPTTTTSTTTTTTSPPWLCEDYDVAHCADPEVKTLVCPDTNLNYLCRKTCKLCEH
ncbi:integumentary mucin C.1-like [Saccostrea echinata]|uniref:integumentary mucin C.1-like n=1 Tax=Saccostrea echinata TaxID=191078 RepID=UPI002A7EE980|nr:integumentary mucin C.1-like [Saccostrea echinata]